MCNTGRVCVLPNGEVLGYVVGEDLLVLSLIN